MSDQFIRTNGLLCYPPTENAGADPNGSFLKTLVFKPNMILTGKFQVP